MKIEMSTNWLPLINPGTYGTLLGDIWNDVLEEYNEDYKKCIAEQVIVSLNEFFLEKENITCSNASFHSPRFYNYSNDSVEFEMEIPDDFADEMYENVNENAYEYFKKNFGSRSGFISFFPYTKEKYETAVTCMMGNNDFEMAVGMYLSWKYDEYIDEIQEDFENEIEEYVCCNTCWIDYEE